MSSNAQSEENNQTSYFANTINPFSRNRSIPSLNWMFMEWKQPRGEWFANSAFTSPRDVLGWLCSQTSLIYNPDMEILVNNQPHGWGVDKSSNATNVTLTRGASSPATNTGYAHIEALHSNIDNNWAGAWLWSSTPFSVTPNSSKRLYVNFFARTNMHIVNLAIAQFDASGNRIGDITDNNLEIYYNHDTDPRGILATGIANQERTGNQLNLDDIWLNYSRSFNYVNQNYSRQGFLLDSRAASIIVTFNGWFPPGSQVRYLDIDAVSCNYR